MTTLNTTLTPSYTDLDFSTAKTNLQSLLSKNPVFKDYNYEGANITLLIELISYLTDLNTYYQNMIAKNQFMSTSELYETTHMLSQLGGYDPMGYRSSSTTLSINIDVSAAILDVGSVSASTTFIIPEWSIIGNSLGITNPDTSKPITFVTVSPTQTYSLSAMSSYITETSGSTYTIPVSAREGSIVKYNYIGDDINNNILYVPMDTYDYDDNIDDETDTIKLYINDIKWQRLSNWYENTNTDNNVFMFKYDKYGRYYIEFSSTRNIPVSTDYISIYMIVSSGDNGNVAASIIDTPLSTFIELESGGYLSTSTYTVTNSAATVGGSGPETINEIKNSTIGSLHSQYRNVTKKDYISYLESRADVVQANVWGEQEQSPSGSVQDYNKVYISVVPSSWDTSTIVSSAGTTSTPITAMSYNTEFTDMLSEYLKPRKILTTYEYYTVPELLYFIFKIGLKIKSNYTYSSVMTDVSDKLTYYFNSYNRTFNELMSFSTISEYLLDTTIVSTTSNFSNIKGLKSIIMRNIDIVVYSPTYPYYTKKTIYEPNDEGLFPYYTDSAYSTENTLRNIQLGYNQFPMLYLTSDTFNLEV